MPVPDSQTPGLFKLDKKAVLDWITWFNLAAAALSVAIGAFVAPEARAKQASYVITAACTIMAVVIFLFRRKSAKPAIPPPPARPGEQAVLRFLLPFEEGDTLPERDVEVQDLETMVASMGFRFGMVCGEFGCGKTSLLRAGLLPRLRARGFLPVYIPNSGEDPKAAVEASLLASFGQLRLPTASVPADGQQPNVLFAVANQQNQTLVIIFDQFEEFFLANRVRKSRTPFLEWVGSCVEDQNLGVVFLFGLRNEFFSNMLEFRSYVPDPTSGRVVYDLRNFDSTRAKNVLTAAVVRDKVPFDAGLIDAIVDDLMAGNIVSPTELQVVRPAELQVVATLLKRKSIFKTTDYDRVGRYQGLLQSYITEAIDRSVDPPTARSILRLLCPEVGDDRRPVGLTLADFQRSF